MKSMSTISCPSCQANIPIDTALEAILTQRVTAGIAAQKLALDKRERELVQQREDQEVRVGSLVQEKLGILRKDLEKKAMESASAHLSELEASLAEKTKLLASARSAEVELRKKMRGLEEKEQELNLEFEKKLDQQLKEAESKGALRASEDHKLKEREHARQLDELRQQIIDLKRTSEQGSQEAQGEVMEEVVEDLLKRLFPLDRLEPVPKGIRGADFTLEVLGSSGTRYGSIAIEVKNAQSWIDGWIVKLKDDQRSLGAELALIVSKTLPKGMTHFGVQDGVLISSPAALPGVLHMARQQLKDVYLARSLAAAQSGKMEVVFGYLTGSQFRQRIEGVIESFVQMRDDLEKEKRAAQRSWSAREKQLERMMLGTSGMYGDLQGILGNKLPELAVLEI